MFDSVDILVDENDRRRANMEDMSDEEETLESAHFVVPLVNTIADDTCSQRRTFRGYKLLVQSVSNFEEKLTSMEVDELVVYFRDVRHL